MSRTLRCRAVLLVTASVLLVQGPASAQIEDYAEYQPQTKCSAKAKPGTKALARSLVRRGGGQRPTTRPCKSGGTSEHKDGRAFDWTLDATRKKDRRIAAAF